ncbi:MAG: alpha/beta hydrolase [Chitinophagaceae bacterium]
MKRRILYILLLVFLNSTTFGQELYIKTFGNNTDKAIIFLHGGPGYNSASFESTTAKQLSEKGFYVIVYDRRGEGRSIDLDADYNFEQTFEDLNNIYTKFSFKKATLIGHSFGGIVATLFAQKYSEKINSVILVGAPVSLQESFKNIITKCTKAYTEKKDSVNLYYINLLKNVDTASIQYSTYCFKHAMQNGFYSTKNPSQEAKNIGANFKKDSLYKYGSKMTIQPPQKFWENESYTTINLTNSLKNLVEKKVNVFGLYGKEDGLYSQQQIENLSDILGKKNVQYIDNCSHSVFIDQQTVFLENINNWLK